MSDDSPCRSWQVIAQELSAETNSEKLSELAEELNRLLESQELEKKRRLHLSRVNPNPALQLSNYQNLIDNAVALMRSDYASLQMLYPERGSGGELRLLAFRGFNPEAANFWEWVRADSKSTCGIALAERKQVIAPDIVHCDFMAGSEDREIYLQTGILACQTTPLFGSSGNVVGMISTHWRSPHQCSEDDLQLFGKLARRAAELIESRLERGDLPGSDSR